MMKINVDAALLKNSFTAAVAAVARDDDGIFQGASALVVAGVSSPEIAKAMAGREGLALARDLGMQMIMIASDCANVVRSIQGPGMALYGHIVREIKAEVMSFTKANFVHEGMNSNGNACRLARSSI
jgi:ribonuclease HI